ncbi:hypothetical protein [Pseudomonas mandelii]|uniref:hypothetical protein n=1 Tax=Pseudomonas mandelii TaxID=75612 RepID=UPI003D03C07E
MVAKIPLPVEDSLAVITRIINDRVRYRDFYERLRADWLRSAELYIEHRGDPVNVQALNLLAFTATPEEATERKQSLIGLYSAKEGQFHYDILASLRRDHRLIICPSCGGPVVPGTLDHYLPKTTFPEFSVLLVNLTPMCNACQEAKGASFLTENNQKKYLHSYFDEIILPIYSVHFSGNLMTPEFSVLFNNLLPPAHLELARQHIAGTKIEERFLSYCETKYIHILKTSEKLRRAGNSELLEFTVETFLDNAELSSINCWEAIFYRSVLSSPVLINYLKYGQLPEQL